MSVAEAEVEDRVEGALPESNDDEAPDSAVRPIPVARITRGASVTPMPLGTRVVDLSIRVSAALMGNAKNAYVTLSIPGGEVVFEGFTRDGGALDVAFEVSIGATSLHALVEAGTKYRHATFTIEAHGLTELAFA